MMSPLAALGVLCVTVGLFLSAGSQQASMPTTSADVVEVQASAQPVAAGSGSCKPLVTSGACSAFCASTFGLSAACASIALSDHHSSWSWDASTSLAIALPPDPAPPRL